MKIRVALILLFVSIVPVAASAADRLAGLSELILSGRAAEARTRLRAAAEEYRKEADVRGEALAFLLLGFADVEAGDVPSARASLQSAAAKLASAGDFYTAWMALLYVAGLNMREGNWEAAVKQHEIALAMLRDAEASDKPLLLDGAMALGPMFGKTNEAFGALPGNSEPMVRRLLLRMAEMMSRDQLGSSLVELGQLERAEKELARALDLSAMFFGLFDGAIAAHVGDLRRRQWRFDEAAQNYRKALDTVALIPLPSFLQDPEELKILGQLAEIELLSGRVAETLEWNDRALAFVRSSPRPAREVSLLDDRATLLMQANRYDDALRVLGDALKLAEQLKDVSQRAWILTSIGSIQMYRGNFGAAAAELEKAIALYETVDKPMEEGHAWTMLTETYLALGAYDSADHSLERVREFAKKGGFAPAEKLVDLLTASRKMMSGEGNVAEFVAAFEAFLRFPETQELSFSPEFLKMMSDVASLGMAGVSTPGAKADPTVRGSTAFPIGADLTSLIQGRELFLRGDIAGAREVWSKGLEHISSRDIRSGYFAAIGAAHWKEGNREEAGRWFKKAADLVDDIAVGIADDELQALYLGSDRRWYFDLVIDMLAQSGNVQEAFEYAERARSRAFLQMIGNHRLEPRRGGSETLVREAESLRLRIAQWERDGSAAGSDLDHARNRYRALMRRVKTSNPEYASLTRIEPLSIDALRADLPSDVTLISYFLTRGGAHAWVVDRESFHHVRLTFGDDALRRAVCWSNRFRSRNARGVVVRKDECADPATAEEVFELFIAPLRDKIRNRRLFIVPHRVLHQIPFGALLDPVCRRYLIEDYTLQFAPSASALRFLREKETPIDGGALVLGNPDGSLGNLEGAQREALVVARELGTRAITGPDATENLLFQLDGSTDLVHIGAHGTYNSASPLFSRIALAPGGGRDGNLDVHEILGELDLRGVNLVVLSACHTAVGERSGGDDVVGLTRAVLYAGSPGVISTLWDIDDDAAAVLMEELYCRLLGGTPAAEALREAQLLLRHSGRYGDPQYWGAFMLTGDPAGTFHRSR